MVSPWHAPDNLRVVVGRQVGPFVAGQADDQAGVAGVVVGHTVGFTTSMGQLDARRFLPQDYTRGRLDHLIDVGAADAGGRFQKVELAIVAGVDELGMGDAARQPEGAEDSGGHAGRRRKVGRVAWQQARVEDAAALGSP